jgi:hypothetical protein
MFAFFAAAAACPLRIIYSHRAQSFYVPRAEKGPKRECLSQRNFTVEKQKKVFFSLH